MDMMKRWHLAMDRPMVEGYNMATEKKRENN
jgi:hypothetical protein